mmetsp:Transcript_15950/g.24034  ORF Transcript_15950/g.24034 Transcript_15950/m.24034 type:complete len:190 (+) Transcript_15950:125-694(+)
MNIERELFVRGCSVGVNVGVRVVKRRWVHVDICIKENNPMKRVRHSDDMHINMMDMDTHTPTHTQEMDIDTHTQTQQGMNIHTHDMDTPTRTLHMDMDTQGVLMRVWGGRDMTVELEWNRFIREVMDMHRVSSPLLHNYPVYPITRMATYWLFNESYRILPLVFPIFTRRHVLNWSTGDDAEPVLVIAE